MLVVRLGRSRFVEAIFSFLTKMAFLVQTLKKGSEKEEKSRASIQSLRSTNIKKP